MPGESQWFQCLAQSTQDHVLVVDVDARVLFTNHPGVGVGKAQVVGSSCYDLLPPHSHESFRAAHARAFSQGEPGEYEVEGASGRCYRCRLVPVGEPGQPPGSALVIASDETELRQAGEREQRLESRLRLAHGSESLALLAGGVAHDFNNLLVGIMGNVELALLELGPGPGPRAQLRDALSAATCAAELTQRLLTYAGQSNPVPAPLDLNPLVIEMLQLLRATISKKARLETSLEPHLPAIEADAVQVRQVIANLVTNASEALDDRPGQIRVGTGVSSRGEILLSSQGGVAKSLLAESYVHLEVADDGCGIEECVRAQIFDPFFSTKFTGRGLGLAACRGIVEAHGGALAVHSQPGEGTTFRAFFPCAAIPLAPADEAADSSAPAAPAEGQGLILVIDDEPHVRGVSRLALERAGYRVVSVSCGEEGLRRLGEGEQVDLVLLDLLLPDLDGREVYQELRRRGVTAPVLLSSGYAESIAVQGLDGLAGFLRKPYRLAELVESVERALAAAPLSGE